VASSQQVRFGYLSGPDSDDLGVTNLEVVAADDWLSPESLYAERGRIVAPAHLLLRRAEAADVGTVLRLP